MFEEYAAHRKSKRGHEEIGWLLLGYRGTITATVVATLPAGALRDAGETHIAFHSDAQAVAARMLRQEDRRLTILGVVHTHPGTMRSPSYDDYRGDRNWVANLRGGEGVFAIGTVASECHARTSTIAEQPAENVQQYAGLQFNWYALAEDDARYRRLPVELTIGPDLGLLARQVWQEVERYATRLEQLSRRFAQVKFQIGWIGERPALSLDIGLGNGCEAIQVVMQGDQTRWLGISPDGATTLFELPPGTAPDQGVYMILAELASRELLESER